ncbi:MAG: hypothetical protein P8X50_10530 [Maritimibacter sp.]
MLLRACVAVFVIAASSAQAECPTGADIAGKALQLSGMGETKTYRLEADGIVHLTSEYSDIPTWEAQYLYGIYPITYTDPYPVGATGVLGSVSHFTRSVPQGALPLPEPGKSIEMDRQEWITYEGSEGMPGTTLYLTFTFGIPTTITIADCSYQDAVPVIMDPGESAYAKQGSYFVPSLGFAITFEDPGPDDLPTFRFVKTIKVVP